MLVKGKHYRTIWFKEGNGADRVTRTGDVANKIGTYLKAFAANFLP